MDQQTLSPRAAATRLRILEAAQGEFAEHGLAGARVDAIAERAGANKRMIYAHFGSKDELWLAVLERVYVAKRRAEQALPLAELAPADAIAELVRFNLRYTDAHPEFVALLHQENLHRATFLSRSLEVRALYAPIVEQLAGILGRGSREGVFRSDVDPLQLYVTIVAVGHFPVANRHTLSAIFPWRLDTVGALAVREAHAVAVVLGYLRP